MCKNFIIVIAVFLDLHFAVPREKNMYKVTVLLTEIPSEYNKILLEEAAKECHFTLKQTQLFQTISIKYSSLFWGPTFCGSFTCSCLIYADGTDFIKMRYAVEKFCESWEMTVNTDKTKFITFQNKTKLIERKNFASMEKYYSMLQI